MKQEEKKLARKLRAQGMALGEIAEKLQVAKSSVSSWVRDIALTKKQRKELTARGFSKDAIEKRRIARIGKTQKRHQLIRDNAALEIGNLSKRELWLVAIALYWGEGSKAHIDKVGISNSDPVLIKIMMRFFREILEIPEDRFRCHVHTFSHVNAKKCEQYWSRITGVPLKQFYKTYTKPSSASKHKKYSLPNGTLQVYVCDTDIQLRILGWIEGMKDAGVPRM